MYFTAAHAYEVDRLHSEGVQRVLLSAYHRDFERSIAKAAELGMTVFLDSGAFSAMGNGRTLSVEWYGRMLAEYAGVCEHYANLDVVGDYVATDTNQRSLEKLGYSPMPVFHYGGPTFILEQLTSRYQTIGLGGLVPVLQTRPREGRDWVQRVTRTYPLHRFHGFGVGITRRNLGLHSADSTAWLVGAKFGKQIGRIRDFRDEGRFGLFWTAEELQRHNIRAMLWLEANLERVGRTPDERTLFDCIEEVEPDAHATGAESVGSARRLGNGTEPGHDC